MGRPYGKVKRTARKTVKAPKDGDASFKISMRHEDGAPLSPSEILDGFYEIVRKLLADQRFHGAKRVTLYVPLMDHDGNAFLPDPSGAWEINPYKSAADEHGV